jgi:hypothetical protein
MYANTNGTTNIINPKLSLFLPVDPTHMNFLVFVHKPIKMADIFFQQKIKKFYLTLGCLFAIDRFDLDEVASVELFMGFCELLNNILLLFILNIKLWHHN